MMEAAEKAEIDVQVCGRASIQRLTMHNKVLQPGERMAGTHNRGLEVMHCMEKTSWE